MAYYAGGGQQQQQQHGYYQQHAPPPQQHHQFQQQPQHMAQQYQQHAYHNTPSGQYGNYGGYFQDNVFSLQAWQAFQFQSQDDLRSIFCAEMSKNPENAKRNAIQSEDLCNIMNNCHTIRQHFGISWNRELCSVMLAMLDKSQDGFMQWEEFLELQQCLVAWHNVFRQHDSNQSGYMEPNELVTIVGKLFGYRLTPDSLKTILKRYSRVIANRGCLIAFDDFVTLSVRLRAYTDAFRKRDQLQHGRETGDCLFQYDDFLRCVLCL